MVIGYFEDTTMQKSPAQAEAGVQGKDVRSDLHVVLEPRSAGDIEIRLESRVAPYYGTSICEQASEVLRALGVEHALVTILDQGGLPFVIAARIEAAVRRAGLGHGRKALPQRVSQPKPSPRERLRRSRLYLPGSEPKYFINAALHGPDAIILDLEDSVHPAEKDAARLLVRNALLAVDFGPAERMVRINQLPLGLADLEEVIPSQPDLILIPKVENPQQVIDVEERAAEIRALHLMDWDVWLMPIVETALGIENAFAIATASTRVVGLTIGLEDYTADLGVVRTAEGHESLYARTRLVNAARAARIQAIDSVFSDVSDLEGLKRSAQNSRALGFEGMGCIHPSQIAVVHEAYSPSPAEIEKALKIVDAFQDARRRGLGVVSLGSKMIDPPVVQRALVVVNRARAMGLIARSPAAAKENESK